MPRRLACALLLLAGRLAAQEQPAPQVSPLTAQASAKFAAGDREGACRDAMEASLQDPSDERALGIAKLSCGKMETNLKFKGLKIQRHETPPEGQAEARSSSPRPQGLSGGVVAPISAPPRAAAAVEATSYGKTVAAQDAASRGRYEDAARSAAEAVAIDPGNMRAHVLLAAAHQALGNAQKSLEAAQAGLRVNAQNVLLLKSKASAQIRLGDFPGAVESADAALKTNATDPMAYVLRAFALGRLGRQDAMFGALRTASALDPSYERLLIEAQNSEEGAIEPFTLPGQVKAPAKAAAVARRKASGDRLKSKLIFMGLLVVLAVVGVLLIHSLLVYWKR